MREPTRTSDGNGILDAGLVYFSKKLLDSIYLFLYIIGRVIESSKK